MAKQFKWRLDTVKRVKERESDARRQALANAQRQLDVEQRTMADLEAGRERQNERLRRKGSGPLDPSELQAIHTFIQSLGDKIKAQAEKVDETRQTVVAIQHDLEDAVKENKVLENLRDKDHVAFRRTERKRDQASMDETAGRRAFDQ